jgi:riboflavin synthase
MFTGIIAAVGRIAEITPTSGGVRMRIAAGRLDLADVALGDSIAVNGVCLTAVVLADDAFEVDVSRETIACTAGFEENAPVNLEKALRLADRLGGHLVSGHVDGVGTVRRYEPVGDNRLMEVELPVSLAKYVARKGSIAVDGVSLTVNDVSDARFSVNLIPHTIANTSFYRLATGARVNIEVDMMARYVERLFQPPTAS